MPETAKPVYLVDAYSDPVVVRVVGRAAFQNSGDIHDFIAECIRQGKTRFVFDFKNCESMDSTFLGVVAGAGSQIRKLAPPVPSAVKRASAPPFLPPSLVLARLSQRNLELVRNLGLHHLATVDSGDFPMEFGKNYAPVPASATARSELDQAKLALEAHENLMAADEGNRSKFQDVVAFLKNRVRQV